MRNSFVANFVANFVEPQYAGAYANGLEALNQIPDTAVRLVLIDIRLPGISGIECARRLKELCPDLKVIMVTALEDRVHLKESLAAGADGFLPKSTLSQIELRLAIETVLAGKIFIAPSMVETLLPEQKSGETTPEACNPLTPRQQEVLDLICQGLGRKAVAEQLKISESTVSNHLQEIYNKLHAHSAHEVRAKLNQILNKPES